MERFRDVQGRIVLLRRIAVVCAAAAIVGTVFNSGDEMPGDCAGSDPCDEPAGTMASRRAPTPRAARTCD